MHTNYTNKKLIYPQLSYLITGICFSVHNALGRFAREKQYCDLIEKELKNLNLPHEREYVFKDSGNRIDFIIDDKIILEVKAKSALLKEDYYQTQRYLQALDKKLGMLINFRNRYIKPKRIVRIDTIAKSKFV